MDVDSIIQYLEDQNLDIRKQMQQIDVQAGQPWKDTQKERRSLVEQMTTNSESANKIYREIREGYDTLSPTMILKLHGDAQSFQIKEKEAQNKHKKIMDECKEQSRQILEENGYEDLRDRYQANEKEIRRLLTPPVPY